MANKHYTYVHPISTAVSLKEIGDIHLHEGQSYDLPEENSFVNSLHLQGRLVEAVKPEPKPTKEKSDK